MDLSEKITLEILDRLDERPRHASEEIARAFRRHRGLFPTQRAAIAEGVYAILRSLRFLDHVIDDAGPVPERGRTRQRARWLAREVLSRRIKPSDARREISTVDWGRIIDAPTRIARIEDPRRRIALAASLPDWLVSRIVEQYGESEAFALARAWNETPPQTLRVNVLRTDRETLLSRFAELRLEAEPTERARDGVILVSRRNVFRSPEFQDGLFELQDEGSQLVSEIVAPPPRGTVIDACAGSGGKTLHLGTLLDGKGRVVAVGVGAGGVRQLDELERRAKRAGLRNVQTVRVEAKNSEGTPGSRPHSDPAVWPPPLARLLGRADRVLVDAPCSGLGVLRRNPEARTRIDSEAVARLAALQRSILEDFSPFVKPGGRLIYATCSVLHEENDAVVDAFLRDHPEYQIMTAKEIFGRERALEIGDGERLRLLPHRHGTDGFFATVMRKSGS